jgi:hypothetical protein
MDQRSVDVIMIDEIDVTLGHRQGSVTIIVIVQHPLLPDHIVMITIKNDHDTTTTTNNNNNNNNILNLMTPLLWIRRKRRPLKKRNVNVVWPK